MRRGENPRATGCGDRSTGPPRQELSSPLGLPTYPERVILLVWKSRAAPAVQPSAHGGILDFGAAVDPGGSMPSHSDVMHDERDAIVGSTSWKTTLHTVAAALFVPLALCALVVGGIWYLLRI